MVEGGRVTAYAWKVTYLRSNGSTAIFALKGSQGQVRKKAECKDRFVRVLAIVPLTQLEYERDFVAKPASPFDRRKISQPSTIHSQPLHAH